MKIGILSAMDKELQLILSMMENVEKFDSDGFEIYCGKIGHHEIIAAKCGIGKVNSALNTYRLIQAASPELIINSGVAGGGDSSMKIGSVLVADAVAYHDVWCGPSTEEGVADGFSRFFTPAYDVVERTMMLDIPAVCRGLICSGDRFISSPEEIKRIKALYPEVLAVDMESASIAQTCSMMHVPFVIVRVVSDTPGEGENISQYQNFWRDAPMRTFAAVRSIIESI